MRDHSMWLAGDLVSPDFCLADGGKGESQAILGQLPGSAPVSLRTTPLHSVPLGSAMQIPLSLIFQELVVL